MSAPTPPHDAVQWDCPDCGDGWWLTEAEAAKGCSADYPAPCGAKLSKRAGVVRYCRLDEDECARRCTGKPGGCDTYGEGLEPDGLGCRVAGRVVSVDELGRASVELDLRPGSTPPRTRDELEVEARRLGCLGDVQPLLDIIDRCTQMRGELDAIMAGSTPTETT